MKFLENTKLVVIALFLASLGSKLFLINSPDFPIYDERSFYLPAVRDILLGKFDPNIVHPPLSKELIAFSINIFGEIPFGYRGLQVLLASIAVVAVYLIAKRIFSSKISFFVGLLILIEPSWFVLSRLAIPEMFMISFFFVSVYFLSDFYLEKKQNSLIIGALFFGLALASKWSVLLFLPILGACFVFKYKANLRTKVSQLVLCLTLVVATYLSTFLFFGYSFSETIVFHQKTLEFNLVTERQIVKGGESFASSALFWPVTVLPLHLEKDQDQIIKAVFFLYNPVILWGSLCAVWLVFWQFLQKKELSKGMILALGFVIFWLPWVFSTRTVFPYYWAVGLPFGIMLFVWKLENFRGEKSFFRTVLMSLALVLSLSFYPLLTNLPVKVWYVKLITGSIEFNNN